MDYYTNLAFDVLDLPMDSNRKKIERVFKQNEAKYLAGKLDDERWRDIKLAYETITNYFKELDENQIMTREEKKRLLKIQTMKLEKAFLDKKKFEEKKGAVWFVIEKLVNEETEGQIDDYLDYIRTQIGSALPSDCQRAYDKFFQEFLNLWNRIYRAICRSEYHFLVQDKIDCDASFSIGEDELRNLYGRLDGSTDFGCFSELLCLGREFSQLIPDEEDNYFLDAHFRLMASFFGFGYKIETFRGTPIYYFKTTSRLIQYKSEFFDMFDEEVRVGIRKSPIVNHLELLKYVEDRLRPYNEFIKKNNKTLIK